VNWATRTDSPRREADPRLPPTRKVRVRSLGKPRSLRDPTRVPAFRHEGREVPVGDEVLVDVDIAQQLVGLGRAERA
jgi:hypothetical protein